jgi:hypothetical protein
MESQYFKKDLNIYGLLTHQTQTNSFSTTHGSLIIMEV